MKELWDPIYACTIPIILWYRKHRKSSPTTNSTQSTMLTPTKLLLTPNELLLAPDEMTKASMKKRAAMSRKSPYARSVAKAAKSVPKKKYTAKEVASAAKYVQGKRTPTKAERLDAKARARAWAKRELGQKKKSSRHHSQVSAAAFGQKESAEDEEDVVDLTENINKEMVFALDQVDNNKQQFIVGDISEDVFYDAMEFHEEEDKQEDFVVEDASDDDDDELINLRNWRPANGQSWMEPAGALDSEIIGAKKPDP